MVASLPQQVQPLFSGSSSGVAEPRRFRLRRATLVGTAEPFGTGGELPPPLPQVSAPAVPHSVPYTGPVAIGIGEGKIAARAAGSGPPGPHRSADAAGPVGRARRHDAATP